MNELQVMLARRAQRGDHAEPDDVINRVFDRIGSVSTSPVESHPIAAGNVEPEYPVRGESASPRGARVWAVVGAAAVLLAVAGIVVASRGDVEPNDAAADGRVVEGGDVDPNGAVAADREAIVGEVMGGPMSPIWVDPADFPAQLAASMEIYGHVEIGMPCSAVDPSWMSDGSIGRPTVFPVGEWDDDGNCTIRGFHQSGVPRGTKWAEDGSPMIPVRDDDGNVITYSSTFPIYDAEGNVIGYQD